MLGFSLKKIIIIIILHIKWMDVVDRENYLACYGLVLP